MKRNLSILLLNAVFVLLSTGALNAQDFWEQTSGPLGGHVRSLAINAGGDIFAGTERGIFRSIDNGDNWVQIGLTNKFVQAFSINSSGHIFAGTAGSGVFRSTDNGNSWTQISTGISNINVQSLAINSADHIFAGDPENGVFRSTDNGDNWTEINTGLTNTIVNSLAINSTSHIFAGTFDGVFRSLETTISVREVAGDMLSSFRLNQNYPNPFNPETVIGYALPIRSDVKLTIYNLRGEEVALLIDGTMPAGNHQVSWDASGFASGIYFYRLQADDFVQTRKMLLLK